MKSIKQAVLGAMLLAAAAGMAQAKHDGEYLHNLNSEFMTPFVEWAKPLAKPPRVLVICKPGYDSTTVVELMRRMDIKCDATMAMDWDMLGSDDLFNGAVAGTSQAEKKSELLSRLKTDYDVYVVVGFTLSVLPREAMLLITQRIAEKGASLIVTRGDFLNPFAKELRSLPVPEGQAEILSMIDRDALSSGAFTEDPKKPADRSLVQTYRFGKGNVVVVSYDKEAYGLFPRQSFSREWLARTECDSALFQRVLLWAAGHRPSVTASCLQNMKAGNAGYIQDKLAQGALVYRLAGAEGIKGSVAFRLRDQDSQTVWAGSSAFRLEKDGALVQARPPLLAPGNYFMDVIIKRDKFVDNIGEFLVKVESPLGEVALTTDKESYKEKEPVKFELATAAPAKGKLEIRTRITDTTHGKVWDEVTRPASPGQKFSGSVIPARVPALSAYLECELISGEKVLAKTSKLLFFPKTGLPVYYSYVWDGVSENVPATGALLGEKAGFDGLLTSDGKACPQKLNMGVVQYCAHINFGFDEKSGGSKWNLPWNLFKPGEKAEEIYGNDQTFYNPKARERVEAPFREWVKNHHQYGVQVYNLGDENGFSYEAGFSPSDLQPFKDFEKSRYGTIEKLNAAWGSAYASFEDVEHLRMKEALDKKNYTAWMDHRAFVENTYADIHRFYSKIIKEYDPKAIVGAEGSNSGDLENTMRDLEYWGPYSDPLGNELVRSLGPNKLRSLWWGGYGGSHGGRTEYPFMLWTPLLTGAVNANSWFSGNTNAEGLTASGLGFAKYFKTLLPHLDALKGGVAQLLISAPLKNDGIAILWSHESDSASLIGTQFQNPKDSIGTFMQYCYAKGIQFDFVTPSMIAKDALKNYKMLFLFGASSVSDKTAETIKAFAEKGGVVVADVNPGVMDEFCHMRQESVLGGLFGVQGIKALAIPQPKPLDISKDLGGKKISFKAARVLSSPESDVMAFNTVGKGSALLLNFGLGAAAQSASAETPFDGLLADILALGNVKPMASLEGVNAERTVFRVRSTKDFDVVGFVASDPADLSKKATLKWAEKRHVYEIGKGYLGEFEQWETPMDSPFKVFSLFKTKQEAPALFLSSETAVPGKPLAIDLAKLPANGVLRLEILRPDGTPLWARPEVIVNDGKKKAYEIWFAYNDPAGDYKVVITDVSTSLKTEKSVRLGKAQ
ncbi:MAG: beta-galactosidase [Terrimicrobiaceae bacterium]